MTYADYRQGNGRFGAAAPGARPEPPPVPLMQAPGPGTPPDGGVPGSRRRITRPRVLWAGIAVAVAAAGYAAGYFTAPHPQATRFLLVTSVPLPAGARLASVDLTTVQVTTRDAAPPGALSSAAAGSVIGQVSATALPRGTFLSQSLLADKGAVPGPAQALVGLALKPGQLPDGSLADGQQVRVVALPETSSGTALTPVLMASTTVWNVQATDSSGDTEVTVVIPAKIAVQLAQYAAQQEVALVAVASGSSS